MWLTNCCEKCTLTAQAEDIKGHKLDRMQDADPAAGSSLKAKLIMHTMAVAVTSVAELQSAANESSLSVRACHRLAYTRKK